MRGDDHPLRKRLEQLAASSDTHARGRKFEELAVALFRASHFRVELSPRSARPRQSDLLVTSTNETYLVECKWLKKPAGSGAVDGLRERLRRVPGPAVGVLFSANGFTQPAIKEVADRRSEPVLLFGREELDELTAGYADLRQTLSIKRDRLLVDAQPHLLAVPRARPSARRRRPGPATSSSAFLATNDGSVPFMSGRGGFGHVAFTLNRTIDWGVNENGFAVDLDVRSVADVEGLSEAFGELAALGWTTPDGSWSVQAAHTNWHGLGAAALLEALADPDVVQARRIELTYVDECAGGFWILTADVDAGAGEVDHAELSIQLEGVPLDTQPLAELSRTLDVRSPITFRARRSASAAPEAVAVDRGQILSPVALIVHEDADDPHDRFWVTGVVVRNPWADDGVSSPSGLPRDLIETELLFCSVRSWHPLSDAHTYHVQLCRWMSASHGRAVVVSVDWPDSELPPGVRDPLGIEGAATRDERSSQVRAAHEGAAACGGDRQRTHDAG